MSERPWNGPRPLSEELQFALDMDTAAIHALTGRFDDNLWGLSIVPHFDELVVDFHFHFEREPTTLDRFEMGEFYLQFWEHVFDKVTWRHHRVVSPRAENRPTFEPDVRWLFLARHPDVVAPDDVEPEEIDY